MQGTSEDIKRRKQLAYAAFNKNKKAICSKKILHKKEEQKLTHFKYISLDKSLEGKED